MIEAEQKSKRLAKLTRGQARPSDLTRTLDDLGVPTGKSFYIVPASELEHSLNANAPGAARNSDPSTAKSAAVNIFPRSGSQRRRIFEAIASSPAGLTAEQAADQTGIDFARSAAPRCAELKRGGWVETHGTREGSLGAEQDVLVLTEKGQAATMEVAA